MRRRDRQGRAASWVVHASTAIRVWTRARVSDRNAVCCESIEYFSTKPLCTALRTAVMVRAATPQPSTKVLSGATTSVAGS